MQEEMAGRCRAGQAMIYPTDFTNAHRRHWSDAELLFKHARWANADQLYGFSAECGLKAVMEALGMPVDTTGIPGKKHRKHIQDIWPTFATFVQGRGGARYLGMLSSGTPFADWSPHNRYANRACFQKPYVQPHRDAARQVRKMVRRAEKDGKL